MPPKPKITQEMIVEAAFDIARYEGFEKINARTVAAKLNCSTQPVMYHFSRLEELHKAVYEKADSYHSEYIMTISEDSENPMLDIGLRYISFAAEEKNLYKLLFQSDGFSQGNIVELIEQPALEPVLSVLHHEIGVNSDSTKHIFKTLFLFVHGYASLIANNSLEIDTQMISQELTEVFEGAVYAAMKGR